MKNKSIFQALSLNICSCVKLPKNVKTICRYIKDEELSTRDDGSTLSVLKDIELLEVSVVTFPAYPTTSVSARKKDFENHKRKQFEQWKKSMRERLSE